MMWKVLLIALLAAVCLVEAGRGGKRRGGAGRGRGRGVPPNAQDVSMWNRTLVAQVAKEVGFTLPENADQIYVMSANKRQLKKENYKKSKTLYDFTGGSSKVILKVKKWCFLLNKPEDLTRDGVLQEIASFNGQTRPATTPVQMYATELEADQATELQGRSAVSAMCGSKPIRALTTTAPTAASDASKTVLVTTLDEQLSITVPMNRRGKKGKKGRGGRRGNRRGNGDSQN